MGTVVSWVDGFVGVARCLLAGVCRSLAIVGLGTWNRAPFLRKKKANGQTDR